MLAMTLGALGAGLSHEAQRNLYWSAKLGWDRVVGPHGADLVLTTRAPGLQRATGITPGSEAMVALVRAYQRSRGLTADGMAGPNTATRWLADYASDLPAAWAAWLRGNLAQARNAGWMPPPPPSGQQSPPVGPVGPVGPAGSDGSLLWSSVGWVAAVAVVGVGAVAAWRHYHPADRI